MEETKSNICSKCNNIFISYSSEPLCACMVRSRINTLWRI